MTTPCPARPFSRFATKEIQELVPYVPGMQPSAEPGPLRWIKLNTNENPYPPSPAVREAILRTLGDSSDCLRRYPDPTCAGLRKTIAKEESLEGPDAVFVGNGSDEVLCFAFRALLKQPGPLYLPDITYSFYPSCCALFQVPYRQVPLAVNDFSIHWENYPADAGAIILANPNSPTGLALSRAEIEKALDKHRQAVVVVDEAYVAFGAETAAPLISRYDNLLVVRTLSKSHSLAGLRLGYAMGQPPLIDLLSRVKDSVNSYPVDQLALCAGIAAIEDRAWLAQTSAKIIAAREKLRNDLQLLGFRALRSQANFLMVHHPEHAGSFLENAMLQRRILVRRFNNPAHIRDWLRITVGTPDECEQLVEALRQILRAT